MINLTFGIGGIIILTVICLVIKVSILMDNL